MDDGATDVVEGTRILDVAYVGTGALVLTSVTAAVAPATFGPLHAVLSFLLFVVGSGLLLWAYALGVSRSRAELIDIAGLFLLMGPVAPAFVRRRLWLAFGVEVVAVVAAAATRPYTEVAFGVLAPTFILGLMGLWAGRYGTFPPRPPKVPS